MKSVNEGLCVKGCVGWKVGMFSVEDGVSYKGKCRLNFCAKHGGGPVCYSNGLLTYHGYLFVCYSWEQLLLCVTSVTKIKDSEDLIMIFCHLIHHYSPNWVQVNISGIGKGCLYYYLSCIDIKDTLWYQGFDISPTVIHAFVKNENPPPQKNYFQCQV